MEVSEVLGFVRGERGEASRRCERLDLILEKLGRAVASEKDLKRILQGYKGRTFKLGGGRDGDGGGWSGGGRGRMRSEGINSNGADGPGALPS